MPQMVNRAFIALAVLSLLVLSAPARADNACIAAIRGAVGHRGKIPADCWRIGPLTLGMTRRVAEDALGPPDLVGSHSQMLRSRRLTFATTLYVFPRNLRKWLALAPAARQDFHFTTLRLAWQADTLVAIAAGRGARIDFPACTPRDKIAAAYRRGGVDFPADFNGIRLDSDLKEVRAAFGAGHRNSSGDFLNYWPVPLAFTGDDKVQEIEIAANMTYAGLLGPAHLAATLDWACRINGFSLRN